MLEPTRVSNAALPSSHTLALLLALSALATACSQGDPPTVTPGPTPAGLVLEGGDQGSVVIEMTTQPPMPAEPLPVQVRDLEPYRSPDGEFSLSVPRGWTAAVQPPTEPGSHVAIGVVFQSPQGDGLISVTQFDNGERPASLGFTVNNVLGDVTGWTRQPGYTEYNRESVIGREDEALRVEIGYLRSNGVPMHSLALFVIDGTIFSMVNVAVEEGSWTENQPAIRDILASYRVPAAPPESP